MTREGIRNLRSQFIADIYRRLSFLQEAMPTDAESGFNGVEKFLNKEIEELEK